MLPDKPMLSETALVPASVQSVFSVTNGPIRGEKSMGIRLALANQSAEFFKVWVRCIRLGTAVVSAIAEAVLVVAMVDRARMAIEARPAVRNRMLLLLL